MLKTARGLVKQPVRCFSQQWKKVKRKKNLAPLFKEKSSKPKEPKKDKYAHLDLGWYDGPSQKSFANVVSKMPPAIDNDDTSYRIVGATVMERTPVCIPEPPEWEVKWENFLEERQNKTQLPPPEMFRPGSLAEREGTLKSEEQETLEAFLDAYVPAPRYTEEDLTDNRRTLNRQLQKSLYLIVKKDRAENAWQFPQGGNREGETIRETAEREFYEECGKKLNTYFLGNAPIGFLQYEASADSSKKGTRVFFQHAILTHHYQEQGDVVLREQEGLVDYAWVTKDELKEYFSPDLLEACKDMLMDQDWITSLDKLADGTLPEADRIQKQE